MPFDMCSKKLNFGNGFFCTEPLHEKKNMAVIAENKKIHKEKKQSGV